MKKGWIQVNKDGAFEDIAPNTMANQVYMDDAKNNTVKDAMIALQAKVVALETNIAQLSLGGTGGSTADQVIASIGALPIRLNVENNNCDSMIKSGLYTHANWENAPAGLFDNQGTLLVIEYLTGNPGWVHQFFMSAHASYVWVRSSYGTYWSQWLIMFGNT